MHKKSFVAFSIILVSFVVAMASFSCASGQKQTRQQSRHSVFFQNTAEGTPNVCEGQQIERQYLMNNGEAVSVICSCIDKNRKNTWYNAVLKGSDPATHCSQAVVVFGEPVAQAATTAQPVASASATVPFMPTVVAYTASSSSMVSATVIQPLPTASASVSSTPIVPSSASVAPPPASSPAGNKMNIRLERYTCAQGLTRRDFYLVVKPNHEQSVHQECIGDHIVCLTSESEQKDVSKPPCTCADNKAPVKINQEQNIWGCK